MPVRVSLYVDGDLVADAVTSARTWEVRCERLAPVRHAATVRAVDASGRWGGASIVLPAVAAPVVALRSATLASHLGNPLPTG
jgi:hypothetical protein